MALTAACSALFPQSDFGYQFMACEAGRNATFFKLVLQDALEMSTLLNETRMNITLNKMCHLPALYDEYFTTEEAYNSHAMARAVVLSEQTAQMYRRKPTQRH